MLPVTGPAAQLLPAEATQVVEQPESDAAKSSTIATLGAALGPAFVATRV